MIPILYESSETQFVTEGICRLVDCLRCNVIEERNGIYECEFEYPVTGRHYGDITEGRIIYCTHDDTREPQPFDIYKRTAPLDGIVTFYAHHISYRLGNVIIKPFSARSCVAAMAGMTTNSINDNPFTFWTDKASEGSFNPKVPISVKEILGGTEGSVLDAFGGGDYEWDKLTVKLHKDRGSDRGVEIRYGKNLSDLTHDRDIGGTYNAAVPYWLGTVSNGDSSGESSGESSEEVLVTLPEWIVKAANAPDGTLPVPMDLSSEFNSQPTEAQLREKAKSRMENQKPWEPDENITVDFVALWQSPEYKHFSSLQRVALCDKVTIIYTALGVNFKSTVIKTDYNVLLNRYDQIELGTVKTSFPDIIKAGTESLLANTASKSYLQAAINKATELITGGAGGHVVIGTNANGEPNEIYVMDTDDIETAVKVLRINMNGIGFSSAGVGGPYRSAWTLDGSFVADFITTGTLRAGLIKTGVLQDAEGTNYWDMETGEFRLAAYAAKENTIIDVDVEYASGTSSTTAPTTGWQTNAPAWESGKYIWQRTKTVDGNGAASYSTPTCIQGARGQNGEQGTGVSAIVEQYYLSTSNTAQKGGSWSEAQPEWSSGKYIWTRSKVTWTDGTTTYTDPVLAKAINGANSSAKAANDAVSTLNSSLNQQGVFNRLTNNGQTQGIYLHNGLLYINATYIATGILADAGNNTTLNLSTGELTMKKGSINLGGNFIVSSAGEMEAKNATLYGRLRAEMPGFSSTALSYGFIVFRNSSGKAQLTVGASTGVYYGKDSDLAPYMPDVNSLAVEADAAAAYLVVKGSSANYNVLCLNNGQNPNGSTEKAVFLEHVRIIPRLYFGTGINDSYIRGDAKNSIYGLHFKGDYIAFNSTDSAATGASSLVTVNGGLDVYGDFYCTGTKSRTAPTENYGERLLYCYETATPYFGDIGEGQTDETGVCLIWLDDVFMETVERGCRYQVFLQKYGEGDLYVSEREATHFVVKGAANLSFGWEAKAAQSGYSGLRLSDPAVSSDGVSPNGRTTLDRYMTELIADEGKPILDVDFSAAEYSAAENILEQLLST